MTAIYNPWQAPVEDVALPTGFVMPELDMPQLDMEPSEDPAVNPQLAQAMTVIKQQADTIQQLMAYMTNE